MTAKNNNRKINALKNRALAFDLDTVDSHVAKIADAFAKRDIFEESQGSLNAKGYVTAKKKMTNNAVAVARLFLACGVEPEKVICHSNNLSSMFNVYSLDKITEIASYVTGATSKLQKVTKAFLACAIIATERGIEIINNETNVRFLNSSDILHCLNNDTEFAEWLHKYRATSISAGAPTQSSQCRNVLDALGIGEIKSVNRARDSVTVNASHDFVTMFKNDFMRESA